MEHGHGGIAELGSIASLGGDSLDAIGIIVVANHDVLVSTAGSHWVLAGQIRVGGSFFLGGDGKVAFMLFGFVENRWLGFDLNLDLW